MEMISGETRGPSSELAAFTASSDYMPGVER